MEIQEMRYDEFSTAYQIADSEGWNIGKNDHKTVVDKSGFFSMKIDGEIVAVIACIKYGTSYANIGLYIVKKECRGMGFGFALWKFALDTVKDRNIGLDATMLQISRYCFLIKPYYQCLFQTTYYDISDILNKSVTKYLTISTCN